jgi:uncharacterized protein YdhG (YjbR/CyaY superfamily)
MTKFTDHDAYIAAAPETFQPLLLQLRAQLAKVLPDAEELIMYELPGFGFGKKIIAGYAAFNKQCGLYSHRRHGVSRWMEAELATLFNQSFCFGGNVVSI